MSVDCIAVVPLIFTTNTASYPQLPSLELFNELGHVLVHRDLLGH